MGHGDRVYEWDVWVTQDLQLITHCEHIVGSKTSQHRCMSHSTFFLLDYEGVVSQHRHNAAVQLISIKMYACICIVNHELCVST